MSISTSDAITLGVGLFIFAGCFGFVGVALYVAYAKLDVMLGYFKNTPAVIIRSPLKNGGPWGRLFVLGGIVGVIKTPGFYIPDGGACVEDIASFPEGLKARLIALYKVGGCFSWALFLFAAITVVDWSSMGNARLGLALLTIVAIPAWILLCLHLWRTQISTIVTCLKNSSAIGIRLKLNAGEYFGRLVFIIAVSVILTCSRIFIKRGTLDSADFETVPRSLRFKLFVLFMIEVGLVVNLFFLCLFGK